MWVELALKLEPELEPEPESEPEPPGPDNFPGAKAAAGSHGIFQSEPKTKPDPVYGPGAGGGA